MHLALLISLCPVEVKTPLYMPGHREWVVGATPWPEVVLSVIHKKEIPADNAAGVYAPSFWDEYPIGIARWSVTESELFSRPCHRVQLFAQTQTKLKFSKPTPPLEVVRQGFTTWFVTPEGRILRQDVLRREPDGIYEAHCTYAEDRIEVQVTIKGKRSITTVYPGGRMADLQRQFEPMVSASGPERTEKSFLVYEPFTGGFSAYSIKQNGKFNSVWLGKPVRGHAWEVRSPDYVSRALITDRGELVKVELPNDNMMITTAEDVKGGSHVQ